MALYTLTLKIACSYSRTSDRRFLPPLTDESRQLKHSRLKRRPDKDMEKRTREKGRTTELSFPFLLYFSVVFFLSFFPGRRKRIISQRLFVTPLSQSASVHVRSTMRVRSGLARVLRTFLHHEKAEEVFSYRPE